MVESEGARISREHLEAASIREAARSMICRGSAVSCLVYFRRIFAWAVGTVQIMPPLPIPKKPRFDEAFYIFGECIKKCGLLRVAQHTILPK
jgi:hypothetical protein